MVAMNLSELELYGHYVMVRTERANALIRRDPREMPRRLRLLLLAVDGQQDLQTYTSNLLGFGEIHDLVRELIQLDMIRLVDPVTARQERLTSKSADYTALESVMDDSRFDNSAQPEDLFYGSTMPGSLEALVGLAQENFPGYQSPQTSVQPIAPATQDVQVESLFKMLDAVRSERTELKLHLMRYKGMKKASRSVHQESEQLKRQMARLKNSCVILFTALCASLIWHVVR